MSAMVGAWWFITRRLLMERRGAHQLLLVRHIFGDVAFLLFLTAKASCTHGLQPQKMQGNTSTASNTCISDTIVLSPPTAVASQKKAPYVSRGIVAAIRIQRFATPLSCCGRSLPPGPKTERDCAGPLAHLVQMMATRCNR